MIINKGKEIQNAYNGYLWKRKETVSLVLFLFVFVPLLFTTFKYVMAWLFVELATTTRPIRIRRQRIRSSQDMQHQKRVNDNEDADSLQR
jgi:hypothetical protein